MVWWLVLVVIILCWWFFFSGLRWVCGWCVWVIVWCSMNWFCFLKGSGRFVWLGVLCMFLWSVEVVVWWLFCRNYVMCWLCFRVRFSDRDCLLFVIG